MDAYYVESKQKADKIEREKQRKINDKETAKMKEQ